MPDGFREEAKPTRKQLQIALQAQKAEAATLLNHVQTMGPLMQDMMKACFEAMRMCRGIRRQLQVAGSLGAREVDALLGDLDMICDQLVEYAAQWRGTIDPSWNPASLAIDKGELPDVILDTELSAPAPDEIKCQGCDWSGYRRDAHKPDGLCPMCGGKVDAIEIDSV